MITKANRWYYLTNKTIMTLSNQPPMDEARLFLNNVDVIRTRLLAISLRLSVCFRPTVKANSKGMKGDAKNPKKSQKRAWVTKIPALSQQLVQNGEWGDRWASVSVEFLGGCGVMQPGVYGLSLPTDGNTGKRGPGPASKEERGHPLWEFPSLLVWAGSRGRRGAPAGVIAGTKKAQNVDQEPCRDLGWRGAAGRRLGWPLVHQRGPQPGHRSLTGLVSH